MAIITTDASIGLAPDAMTAPAVTNNDQGELAALLSKVPWLSFCVVAKPDIAELANNDAFKSFINHIITTTATTVSNNIQSQLAAAVNEVTRNTGLTLDEEVKSVQDTIMKEILGLPLQAAVTEYEKSTVPTMEQFLKDLCKVPPRSAKPFVLPPPSLPAASWIWTCENAIPAQGQPVGYTRAFRRTIVTERPVNALTIDITADDMYTIYVNGKVVGSGQEWRQPDRYTIRFEDITRVVVAIVVSQGPALQNIGVLAAMKVWNGFDVTVPQTEIVTDGEWVASPALGISEDFIQPDFVDASWIPASVVALYGAWPWVASEMKPVAAGNAPGKGIQAVLSVPDAPDAPEAEAL